jgi:hypothetical protein
VCRSITRCYGYLLAISLPHSELGGPVSPDEQ